MRFRLCVLLLVAWGTLCAQNSGAPAGNDSQQPSFAADSKQVESEGERMRNFSERMIEEMQTLTVMEVDSPEYAKYPGFIMPGYRNLRFYMLEDEVRKIIQDDGYIATGKQILDSPVSLYYQHNTKGVFTFYRKLAGKYFSFDFTKNKFDLYWQSPHRLFFLDRDNDPYFRILRTEQGEGKKDENWKHSFLFIETIKGHRLVGVSLNYSPMDYKSFDYVTNFQNAEDSRILMYLPRRYGERILVAMDKMYGVPLQKSYESVDKFSERVLRTYQKDYVWDIDINIEGEGRMLSTGREVVQINISFTRFAGRILDFQITYLLPGVLDKMMTRFSSRPPDADNQRPLYPPVPQLR